MRIVGVLLFGLSACRCTPDPVSVVGHVPGFEPLVAAVVRDDVAAALQWSEGLVGPDEPDDGGASVGMGAALGFLRVSVAPDERAMALVRLSASCGRCLIARGLLAPAPTPFSHEGGAVWVLDALLWGRELGAPETSLDRLSAAFQGTSPVEDATRALEACQSCHVR